MLLPEADEPTLLLATGHAMRSDAGVAALEIAASRARFFASRAGRPVTFEDVECAMAEAEEEPSRPPAPTVRSVFVIPRVGAEAPRRAPAKAPRTPRGLPAADRLPLGKATAETNFSAVRPPGFSGSRDES